MRKEGLAAVIMILLAAGLGVGYLAGGGGRGAETVVVSSQMTQTSTTTETVVVASAVTQSSTTTSTVTQTSTTTSTITSAVTSTTIGTTTVTTSSSMTALAGLTRSIPSNANLLLTVSLNTTSIQGGKGVSIGVSMTNLLSTSNSVASATTWPLTGLIDNSCGTTIYPMGIEVIRGTNLSAASSSYLTLFHPGPQSCPNEPAAGIPSYVFKADSQWAIPENVPAYYPMNATLEVSGYWTWNGIDPNSAIHHLFEPGIYTVAAGDEWGDVVLLHFTVA